MENPLDIVAVRVLGSLMEKEATTPDNYPLTINALTAACNQTTNREPVLSLDEDTVQKSVQGLIKRSLVREVFRSDSRAKRYRHLMSETMKLHPAEVAVMCVLMLRGAQTPGEIKGRTGRLFEFSDLAQLDITLDALRTLEPPLVVQLPRQPGQKEVRWAHLLSGEPQVVAPEAAPVEKPQEINRVEALERDVEMLRAEVAELRSQLDAFRQEFQ